MLRLEKIHTVPPSPDNQRAINGLYDRLNPIHRKAYVDEDFASAQRLVMKIRDAGYGLDLSFTGAAFYEEGFFRGNQYQPHRPHHKLKEGGEVLFSSQFLTENFHTPWQAFFEFAKNMNMCGFTFCLRSKKAPVPFLSSPCGQTALTRDKVSFFFRDDSPAISVLPDLDTL